MDSNNPFGLSEDELKFVNQKYVKWGIIALVVGILSAAVIWGGINIAPLIALALANWIWALVYLAGGFMAFKVITNPWLIRAISRFIDNKGYNLYIWTIQQDPLATAEGNLAEMEQTGEEIDGLIGDLQGAKSEQEEQLAEMDKSFKNANSMAIQAKQEGDETMAQVYMEEALGYKNATDEALPYYTTVGDLVEYYLKAQKWVQGTVLRYRKQLDSKKRLFKIAELSEQSVKKIKQVMGGRQFREFRVAMDIVSSDIHKDLGKVKNFMRATKPILDKQDFEARTFSREAAAQFALFVKDAPFLSDTDKSKLLNAAPVDDESAIPAQLEAGMPKKEEAMVSVAQTSGDKFNRF